jgi:competence protein ComEC
MVTVALLGFYVWFVDFPPSLVRSYAMVLVGWMVLLLGVKLLSYTFLTTILLMLVVLFPSLLVSLSFWLSVAGVFYIFLLLQYFISANKWLMSLVVIPFGIFMLMLPVVHGIFGMTSVYQLSSPLLSLLFVPFYPLAMGLHLFGWGDSLDSILLWLFSLPKQSVEALLLPWVVFGYVGLSMVAIWSRRGFYVLCSIALMYGGYLFL